MSLPPPGRKRHDETDRTVGPGSALGVRRDDQRKRAEQKKEAQSGLLKNSVGTRSVPGN